MDLKYFIVGSIISLIIYLSTMLFTKTKSSDNETSFFMESCHGNGNYFKHCANWLTSVDGCWCRFDYDWDNMKSCKKYSPQWLKLLAGIIFLAPFVFYFIN